MKNISKMTPELTIGIDLGDRVSHYCKLDCFGEVLERGRIATASESFHNFLSAQPRSRVVIEVGTHSPWVSRSIVECGHELIVANAFRVKLIHQAYNKGDRVDAEVLARLGRVDPLLLAPIRHRGAQAQSHRAILTARDALVRSRTLLINCAKGTVKSFGGRLPKCSSEAFARKGAPEIPDPLRPALEPLLAQVGELTSRIKDYNRQIEEVSVNVYPETARLRQITGVGPITSLAFVLTIDDPTRFSKSREVGPYLGLTPRRNQSGGGDPQLGITKQGDAFLRRLLVSGAQYILGPFGPDCDLKRYGERIAERGGKNAKKRAVVAVARKLAVLLHKLWVSEAEYDPLYNSNKRLQRAA